MALVTQFLTQIRGLIIQQNADDLGKYLQVEPNAGQAYHDLGNELRTGFPDDSNALSDLVEKCLPEEDDVPEGRGSPWPGFIAFMKEYLSYWRGADFNELAKLHVKLSRVLTCCATALGHPSYGKVMFPTSISVASSLVKLAMILHKNPLLQVDMNQLMRSRGETKTIVESTADTIQKIFTICLTDRSSGRFNKPEGKKTGLYICVNLVLKLLFTINRSRFATQILTNIDASGPALSLFPKPQQVTYLYYLGRYWWENNQLVRASNCLERAYFLTPPQYRSQRRLILTYLLPVNIIIGRLPTQRLLDRPEVSLCPLKDIFTKLSQACRTGDFPLWDATLFEHKDYLWKTRLYVSLRSRSKAVIWRSLTRRIFLLTYQPLPPSQDNSKRAPAPTLDFADVLVIINFIQHRLEGYLLQSELPPKRAAHTNALFLKAVSNTEPATTLVPPPGGPKKLMMTEGIAGGNMKWSLDRVQSHILGLVAQGFLHGFVSHSLKKFAITGANKAESAVKAGWPDFWSVLKKTITEEDGMSVGPDGVPAWVQMPKGSR